MGRVAWAVLLLPALMASAVAQETRSEPRNETRGAEIRSATVMLPHCAAVPLGVMVRGVMESLLDAEALEELLRVHAPEQFTLELTIDARGSLTEAVRRGIRLIGTAVSRLILPKASRTAHPSVRRMLHKAPIIPTSCIPAGFIDTRVLLRISAITSHNGL